MKLLIPVDASQASLAALHHAAGMHRAGVRIVVILLNVQPPMHRHISRYTTRGARDALRRKRSAVILAPAIETLTRAGVPFVALRELGAPAAAIAAVARREAVDEIVMGVGRHSEWLRWINPSIARGVMARTDIPVTVLARGKVGALQRYAVPAGIASLAALLWAVE